MKVEKITVRGNNGEEIEMEIDYARELYAALDEMFSRERLPVYSPYYEYPIDLDRPYYTTYPQITSDWSLGSYGKV